MGRRFHGWRMTLLAWLLLATLPAPIAHAASLAVNSLADTDSANNGVCTLREAITAANNNANYNGCASASYGNDTITFSVGGTITLGSSLPNISDAAGLTINGGGTVTISGNNAVRVLQVNSGAALTLQNLTIANGNANLLSGGLHNSGTATINNSTFSNNQGSFGGAISNVSPGTVTINNSTFSGNSATNSGGAIDSSSPLTISNSTFSANSAASGGGISSSGTATISSSTFSGNTGGDFGGAISSSGPLTISNSAISGNQANSGGGIIQFGSTLMVVASTLSGNTANTSFGGALENNGGTAALSNTTLSGNSASFGGGIYNGNSGTITVNNSTIANNSAPTGAGIDNFSGTASLANSIVANSSQGGNCAGTITNSGHNLDSATSCGWGSNNGSLSGTNPKLGPLASNGGRTQTHALLTGSPAIDAGNNNLIPTDATDQDHDGNTSERLPLDQRGLGFPRIIHRTVDIGAFEAGFEVYLPMTTK